MEVDSDESGDLDTIGIPTARHHDRDSWRAGRIERVHGRFGGEGLVRLGNQDLAPYPTRGTGVLDHEDGKVREMRNAETILVVTEQGDTLASAQENTGKLDDAKVSCPVWGGAEGEGLLTQYLACGLLHQVPVEHPFCHMLK